MPVGGHADGARVLSRHAEGDGSGPRSCRGTACGRRRRDRRPGRFLAEIVRHPLLTADDEVRLAKRVERGDPAAKTQMIESNLRLVVSIAKQYRGLAFRSTT